MPAPIKLTESAQLHIQGIVNRRGLHGFRLAVRKDGCSGWSYDMDVVERGRAHDVHIMCRTLPVYLDRESLEMLKGTEIDYIDLGMGQKQLVFQNPNIDQTCGCGDSFSVKPASQVGKTATIYDDAT